MDYSLLLGIHNITEEMKPTKTLSSLNSSLTIASKHMSSSDMMTNAALAIDDNRATTVSTDPSIAMTAIRKIPTYVQYIRVIEFVRIQEPSLRSSSILNAEDSTIDHYHNYNHMETESVKAVKTDLSAILDRNISDNQSAISKTNRTIMNHNNTSSPFHSTNASLIGGDIWYNRQNLSRLAMYVIRFFFFFIQLETYR